MGWLEEKTKLVVRYKLHHYFLENDYERPHYQYILSFLKKNNIKKDVKILEACCGLGSLAFILKENGYTNYFGVDKYKEVIEVGKDLFKKYNFDPERLICVDAAETNFPDHSFDLVFIMYCTVYSSLDLKTTIKEAYRILKKNGFLLVDAIDKKCEGEYSSFKLYSHEEIIKPINELFSKVFIGEITECRFIVEAIE